MSITVSKLLDQYSHALGGGLDTDADVIEAINQAGRRLHSMHEWSWASKAAQEITATEDQTVFPLNGSRGLIAVVMKPVSGSAAAPRLQMVEEIDIVQAEALSGGDTGTYPYTVAAPTVTEDPVCGQIPAFRIWPAASAGDLFTVFYRADWAEVVENDSVVHLPNFMHDLLIALVRIYAKAYDEDEGDGGAPIEMRLQALEGSKLVEDLKMRDGQESGDIGHVGGGAMLEHGYQHYDGRGVTGEGGTIWWPIQVGGGIYG